MRIVNREEFMKLPSGTVFHHYDSTCFEGLYIKDDTIVDEGENIDWFETRLDLPFFEYCSDQNLDAVERMEEGSIENADYSSGRDGCFDHDQLYAVLSREEVEHVSRMLAEALVTGY